MKGWGLLSIAFATTQAIAAPEVLLDGGQPGDTDKVANFVYGTKTASMPFRWTVRIKANEFASVTPSNLVIRDISNSTQQNISLNAASFIDKVVHVCSLRLGSVCYYTTAINYKFATGTVNVTPTRDSQTYSATFNYIPSGASATSITSKTQTVGGLDRYCGAVGYDLGLLRYVPSGTAPAGGWPVVVLMHGGYWKDRSVRDMITYANDLRNAGYYVVNTDYRLAPDSGRFNDYFNLAYPRIEWPEFKAQNSAATNAAVEASVIASTGVHLSNAVADAKCSIRHIRAQATNLNINPNKIAVMGYSAGGHLSMLSGLTSDGPVSAWENQGGYAGASTKVQAVVSIAAPSGRLADIYRKLAETSIAPSSSSSVKKAAKEIVCDFRAALGMARSSCFQNDAIPPLTPEEAALFTPYEPNNPSYTSKTLNAGLPVLMVQGAKDELMTLPDTESNKNVLINEMVSAMTASAQAAGVQSNIHFKVFDNGTHGDFNGGALCASESTTAAIAFLDAYMKNGGTPDAVQNMRNTLANIANTCQ